MPTIRKETDAETATYLRRLTSGRHGLHDGLQLQHGSVQQRGEGGGGLAVIGDIDEPVVPCDGPQNVPGALQPVLELIMGRDVLDFVSKVRVGPQLRSDKEKN